MPKNTPSNSSAGKQKMFRLMQLEILIPMSFFIILLVITALYPSVMDWETDARDSREVVYKLEANPDAFIVQQGNTFAGNVLDNDQGRKLRVKLFDVRSEQGADVIVKDNGDFQYNPAPQFTGEDSFNYIMADLYGNYAKTQVILRVAK